jgi:hypothetical protein
MQLNAVRKDRVVVPGMVMRIDDLHAHAEGESHGSGASLTIHTENPFGAVDHGEIDIPANCYAIAPESVS